VPYTDGGIQLVVNNLKASLRRGQEVGGISPDELDADGKTIPGFIITAPLRAEITDAEAASRILNVSFSARLAGAIHVVNVTGSLSYSFN
jgi:predicted ATP-grasp superfamily ATP-dependent carboligase